MKNFLRIFDGANVMPLMAAIQRQPALWNQNTLRTQHPGTAHSQVDDIWLRFNVVHTGDEAAVIDQHESVNYPALDYLPQARPLIFGLMAQVEGERLGRCLITKLRPGKRVLPHVDGGDHAAYYDRYHIVLASRPGNMFRCGDEHVHMRPGEVWWFDNSVEHEVVNNSDDDRVHLIVDIRASHRGF